MLNDRQKCERLLHHHSGKGGNYSRNDCRKVISNHEIAINVYFVGAYVVENLIAT